MFAKPVKDFLIVPFESICKNGLYLEELNKKHENEAKFFCLVAPNGYVVDNQYELPYRYSSVEEAVEEAEYLMSCQDYSTCGGVCRPSTRRKA